MSEDLLKYLARSLVQFPDDVQVTTNVEGDITVYSLSVNQSDMGRLIGRSGRTAKALRELVGKAAACNNEGRVQVVILEER